METTSFIIGIGVAFYLFYTHGKIFLLEEKIKKMPTVEELAKEVIKVKLPINELPPELKNAMMEYVTSTEPLIEKPKNIKTKTKESYIG